MRREVLPPVRPLSATLYAAMISPFLLPLCSSTITDGHPIPLSHDFSGASATVLFTSGCQTLPFGVITGSPAISVTVVEGGAEVMLGRVVVTGGADVSFGPVVVTGGKAVLTCGVVVVRDAVAVCVGRFVTGADVIGVTVVAGTAVDSCPAVVVLLSVTVTETVLT